MPASSISGLSSDRLRRPRITTACIICRARRVKCNRARPKCAQCIKGHRTCEYTDGDAPKITFINEHRNLTGGRVRSSPPPSSDTWGSVVENQVNLLKKSDIRKDGVPMWAVAEEKEPSRARTIHLQYTACPNITPIDSLGELFVFALTNHLPPRETCNQFFESFMLDIQPIIPICHIPTLRREYEHFWANISPNYPLESCALLLAVLYTGAANSTSVENDNCRTLLRLYEQIFSTIDFSAYPARVNTASIQLLQGYIILNTFKASYLSPFSAYGFLPQTIRFAQTLRLHVDRKTGDDIELEVRRRIWWYLLFLDIESTVATGLPPIIHRSGYTTQLPSLLDDYAIPASLSSVPQPDTLSPMMIAMHGHYEWARRIQSWSESLPSQDEVLHFKTLIDSLIQLIVDIKTPEGEWARSSLKMQVDRAYCMLGLRFWQLDQYKGTGCHSEVVKTSRCFTSQYIYLSTAPAFARYAWFSAGLIQPLHALIILLMHLSTCPNIEEEEVLSRVLLDTIVGLRVRRLMNGTINPQHRVNPRYSILVGLRKRIWAKVGWDTDGKGIDPFGGRLKDDVVSGWYEETMGDLQLSENEVGRLLGEQTLDTNKSELSGEGGISLEGFDSIMAGDPSDMFQWDEWESLASEFFLSS